MSKDSLAPISTRRFGTNQFLMKKEKPNTITEIRDLLIHMEKVALGIKSELYKPHDKDFNEFAINLFRLAADIKTFIRGKANLE